MDETDGEYYDSYCDGEEEEFYLEAEEEFFAEDELEQYDSQVYEDCDHSDFTSTFRE